MSSLLHTLRRLAHSPTFTVISLITLAIGIGANTAIFSVINGVLLKPLPYPRSEQLIALWHTAPGINIKDLNMAPSLYFTYSEENRVFQDVGMWTQNTSSVTGLAEPEEVPVLAVTNRFFPMLQLQPALGREFTAADDDPKSNPIVILSDGYWKARFGGDPAVLGRRILVDGDAREVIGVLPPSFQFMDRKISLVIPLRFNRAEVRLINFSYQGIARLKPGVTLAQANADVARMIPLAAVKFAPNSGASVKMFESARIAPNLRFLKDDLLGDIGNTLWVLMGTVGIVLLIACANVANLLLVRAEGRQQELAIRAALGAGWGRIARELLLESMSLGVAGGALGLALAYAALRVLATSESRTCRASTIFRSIPWCSPSRSPFRSAPDLLFGLIPVFKYARPQLSRALRGGGRSAQPEPRTPSRAQHSRRRAGRARPGAAGQFRPDDPHLPGPAARRSRLLPRRRTCRRCASAIPRGAGARSRARDAHGTGDPEPSRRHSRRFRGGTGRLPCRWTAALPTIPSMRKIASTARAPSAHPPLQSASRPGYVATMGTRLIAGRDFTWTETYNQTPVALVSENVAREMWQNPRAAIGKRIRASLKDDWREVVGVVADERSDGVDQKPPVDRLLAAVAEETSSGQPVALRRSVAYVSAHAARRIHAFCSPNSARRSGPSIRTCRSPKCGRSKPFTSDRSRARPSRWCCSPSRAAWRCCSAWSESTA